MLKHKVFTKLKQKKLTFFIKFAALFSVLFVIYQFIIVGELGNVLKKKPPGKDDGAIIIVRGTHEKQARFYENKNGSFTCITSMETIEYFKVNDDYCDCLDGTDEPGTNACSNGIFYCENQATYYHYPKVISSSKVNDGICDCCDGSDEWKMNINKKRYAKMRGKFHQQCKNLCSHLKLSSRHG